MTVILLLPKGYMKLRKLLKSWLKTRFKEKIYESDVDDILNCIDESEEQPEDSYGGSGELGGNDSGGEAG